MRGIVVAEKFNGGTIVEDDDDNCFLSFVE